MDDSWNFSDETIVGELHRAIDMIGSLRKKVAALEKRCERMQEQHCDFIHHFGEADE